MKRSVNRQSFVGVMILALLLAMAIPATAMGQGRGKGRGHNDNWGNNSWRHNNKKCQKFRNCHDARDGRWDGRGPSGNRVGNSTWRNRNRNWDGNRRWRLRRARLQTRY